MAGLGIVGCQSQTTAPALRAQAGSETIAAEVERPASLGRLDTGRPAGQVNALAFSPNGAKLLTGGADGTVYLWDANTGQRLRQFRYISPESLALPLRAVYSVAMSPDGQKVAASGWGDELWCWQALSGEKIHSVGGDGRYVVFSSDGWLATDGHRNGICLWSARHIQSCGLLPGEIGHPLHEAAFSPGGKLLATAGEDHVLKVWELNPGNGIKPPRQFRGHKGPIRSVAFTSDGKRLLSGGTDRTVRVWDIATGKEQKELGHYSDSVLTVRCCPDGKAVATACADGTITLWDLNTDRQVRRLVGWPTSNLFGQWLPLAFSPDGKRLAIAGSRHPVEVWDVATGKEVLHLGERRGGVNAVAITSDGRSLAVAGPDGPIHLWEIAHRREVRQLTGHESAVRSLAFSSGGKVLASAGDDHTLRLWDPVTGKELRCITTGSNDGHRVAFSADGRMLASGNGDGSVDLWETASGRRLQRLEGRGWGPPVSGLGFSPDGKVLASAGVQQPTRLWDVTTGKQVRELGERDQCAMDIAFSPDGRTLASADCSLSWEARGRVWDCATGTELRSFKGEPASRSWSLAFSPDGKSLFLVGEDGLICVCETATGKERRRLSVPVYLPTGIAYAPQGQVLACGGLDGVTRLWDLTGLLRGGHPRSKRLAPSELNACWDALASADAKRAYESVWVLAAAPESAVPFLTARLRPPKPDPEAIARLIRDLDSEDYAIRRQASAALEKQGEAARPALQRALKSQPSLEVRKRINRLLEVPIPDAASHRLRESRVVEALEQMETPEAIRLLEMLSKDEPETVLSGDAQTALDRLKRLARRPNPR